MIWSILKPVVKEFEPKNMDQLAEAIQKAWESIDMNVINKLVYSFTYRLMLLIQNDGKSIADFLRSGLQPKPDWKTPVIPDEVDLYAEWFSEIDENLIDETEHEEDVPFGVDQHEWVSWSVVKRREYKKYMTNKNAFLYRNLEPGEVFRTGSFTKEEKNILISRAQDMISRHGIITKNWGILSQGIPGRVGYQCANCFRQLLHQGEISYNYDETARQWSLKVKE